MDGFAGRLRYDSAAWDGGAMLLQCETQARGEEASLAAGWLHPETFESLVELNELSLALLAEQAAARTAPASLLLRQVGELWCGLDAAARPGAPPPSLT